MPDSQNTSVCTGSKTMESGELVILAGPAPVPRACQLAPLSSVAQRPASAMPATTSLEQGLTATTPTCWQEDALPARLLVTFFHCAGGPVTLDIALPHEGCVTPPPPAPPAPPAPPPPAFDR